MTLPAIEIRGLSKRYSLGRNKDYRGGPGWFGKRRANNGAGGPDHIWALKNIKLDIYPGEQVGLVGRNGAGKSTLLKILSRVTYPSEGRAIIRGRLMALLESDAGFSNEATGRENIYLNAALHRTTRDEISGRVDEIIDFAELRPFVDTPIKYYSSGMRSRLAFAIAAYLEPSILILDEVLSVGDLAFQQKCRDHVKMLMSDRRTLLFVSHSLDSILQFCSRCIWIDHGRVIADGPARRVTAAYMAATNGVESGMELHRKTGPSPGAEPGTGRRSTGGGAGTPETNEEATRVISATVIDKKENTVSTVSVDQDVGISIILDVLVPGKHVEPALHFKDKKQSVAFVVAFTSEEYPEGLNEAGRYRFVCWVPPHLLNTEKYTVSVHLVRLGHPLTRYCRHDDLITFSVRDADSHVPSARGRYRVGRFPGAVRPLLKWQSIPQETASTGAGERRNRADV